MSTPEEPMARITATSIINGRRYEASVFTLQSKWNDNTLRKKFKNQLAKNLVLSILEDFEPHIRVSYESDMSDVTPDPT